MRTDAPAKVRGALQYGADLEAEGMLWGALVPSPVAHGRLVGIDAAAARAMTGVRAVVTGEDLDRLLPKGGGDPARRMFPSDELTYRHQPVAAVAADSLAAARAAAAAVRVTAQELSSVDGIEEIFPDWPGDEGRRSPHVVAHVHARRGDLEGAFASAEFVLSQIYRTSGVAQVALEPHVCLARVEGDRYYVRTSTQAPFAVRSDTAEILGVPESKVVVEGSWVGGGFGGKASALLEPYAVVLAAAAGRPVRLGLSYREEFLLGRSTLPAVVRIDSSVAGGTITGRRVRLLLDAGAMLPGRDFATGFAIGFLAGPYRIGAVELEGYAVRTHKPPFGAHRAPFAPQCAFVVESHMDAIARRAGIDPIDLRLAHAWQEGDETPLGQRVGPFGLRAALERAAKRRSEWRADGRGTGGIGVACGFWSTGTGAGGEVSVTLSRTGVRIVEGEREIGSGSVVRGLVAVVERLTGLPPAAVRLEYRATDAAPFDSGVFGSRTVGALGRAVETAVRTALATLAERAGVPEVGLVYEAKELRVRVRGRARPLATWLTAAERKDGGLTVRGRHYGRSGAFDAGRVLDGEFYAYTDFTASVALAQAAVDPETGAVRPERVAEFLDVGVALDPEMIRSQMEGGIAMGLGEALTEETLWAASGRLGNPGLLDYRVPTLGEIPPLETETIEGYRGAGPFGAKGVGEPPIIPVPGAIANAVLDATDAQVPELPMTPERVARALKPL